VADDGVTEAFIESLPQGKTLRAREITQPRSRARNRLYWALLNLVSENLTDVPAASLHEWVKLRLGVTVAIPLKNGKTALVPGSISFDSMPEEEFAPYLDRTVDLLCGEILPGLGKEDVLAMAREMVGATA
jgi:hypothetical protein